jgi:hypothetical protein
LSQGETPKAKDQLGSSTRSKASELERVQQERSGNKKESKQNGNKTNICFFYFEKQEGLEAGKPKLGKPCETELSQGATPKENQTRMGPTQSLSASLAKKKGDKPKTQCETELSQGATTPKPLTHYHHGSACERVTEVS